MPGTVMNSQLLLQQQMGRTTGTLRSMTIIDSTSYKCCKHYDPRDTTALHPVLTVPGR